MLIRYSWERFWARPEDEVQQQDFLRDPRGIFGNERLITLDRIQEIPFLILLGNPGAGKTYALEDAADHAKASGELCIFKKLNEYSFAKELIDDVQHIDDFQLWRSGDRILYLFLDSLDEGRLEVAKLEHDLQRYFRTLPADRLRVRITCRAAELPHDFHNLMAEIWKEPHQIATFHLMPLREKDVRDAAIQRREAGFSIDPDKFLEELKAIHIEPLAALPVTLEMLFGINEKRNRLPNSRNEAYELGCKWLASELSKTRIDDGNAGVFDTEQRLGAARTIAAITIIGNKLQISEDEQVQSEPSLAILNDFYIANESSWLNPIQLLQETLKTGLFTPASYRSHSWTHRTYGEFLAADFIAQANMSLEQIKSLLINPIDKNRIISTKLHETAAWLASEIPDVFDWILNTEPIILVQSTSIQLTDEQKHELVAHFINHYASHDIIEERLEWTDVYQLCHPDLGQQVAPYLADKTLALRARYLAFDFVAICDLTTIDDTLIALALDRDEDLQIRRSALAALNHPRRVGEQFQVLRPLIFEPSEYKANSDIVAETLNLLFPDSISASEFFSRLRLLPREHHVIGGALDRLKSEEIVDRLAEDDLPIALDWVAGNDRGSHELALADINFIDAIMRRAWDSCDSREVREAFARAAWQRLINFNEVLLSRESFRPPDRSYSDELISDSTKRHQLLETMLDVLRVEALTNEKLLFFLSGHDGGLPWVILDDVPWVVSQAIETKSDDRRIAYVYLARSVLSQSWSVSADLVEWLYARYEDDQNPIVTEYFRSVFDSIDLDSDIAKAQHDHIVRRRGYERKRAIEIAERSSELYEQIIEGLERCEDDYSYWWVISRSALYSWHSRDIRKSDGWQLIESDPILRGQVIHAAQRYIAEQNPYIADVKSHHDEVWERLSPGLEGYRALLLLGNEQLLETIDTDHLRRWAPAVVFNFPSDDTQELDKLLLRNTFNLASTSLIARLREIIEHNKANGSLGAFLSRFAFAPNENLDQMLLEQLKLQNPESEQFTELLRFLVRRDLATARQAHQIAAAHLVNQPDDDASRLIYTRIIHTLSYATQTDIWWSDVWKLIKDDLIFAKFVFDSFGEWHHPDPFMSGLTESQLYDLYLLAIQVYRFEDDIDFHGGLVPPRYSRQEWRDNILRELVGRGTLEAVDKLEELKSQIPEGAVNNINWLIEQARARYLYESWIPPTPQTILQLAADRKRRLPRNADQLLDLVLETLDSIQRDFRGDAAKKYAVWDWQADSESYRPTNREENFADVLASWLRRDLGLVTVNREPHVMILPQSAERTDIQIETWSDTDTPLMVIVEVKCCWYQRLYAQIQKQLVDTYLANHSYCSHGIYLVGYFASPQWDPSDSRFDKCNRRDKTEILQKLKSESASLQCKKPIVVKPYLFDASM